MLIDWTQPSMAPIWGESKKVSFCIRCFFPDGAISHELQFCSILLYTYFEQGYINLRKYSVLHKFMGLAALALWQYMKVHNLQINIKSLHMIEHVWVQHVKDCVYL